MGFSEFTGLKGLAANRKPHSLAHIKQFTALNSELANFLKAFASEDFFYEKWDFNRASDVSDFTLAADNGATAFANANPINSLLVGATGAVDDEGLSALGPKFIARNGPAYFHCHFKYQSVAGNIQFEMGLIDGVTDGTLPAVTDIDTPAVGNGAAVAAVLHMDTDQTLKTMAFVTKSWSGPPVSRADFSVPVEPVVTVPMCVRIFIEEGHAFCVVDNKRTQMVSTGNFSNTGAELRPWFYARNRVDTSRSIHIDMIEVMGQRSFP